ncbi:MAG TPA: hypothetical protein VIG33_15675 [Pseudobdellovibrionaceae bacterium]|jgi:hypothetical protein
MKHLICAVTILFSLNAFAHGEDKLGPNGGFIQMPGAYHTELVPDGTHKLKVFFLDISWQTQGLNDSSVEIIYKGKKTLKSACEPQKTQDKSFFECIFPKDADLTKNGKLIVTSQHNKQKGNDVTYPLPLKLQNTSESPGSHH